MRTAKVLLLAALLLLAAVPALAQDTRPTLTPIPTVFEPTLIPTATPSPFLEMTPTFTPVGFNDISPASDRQPSGEIEVGDTVEGELTFEVPALTYTLPIVEQMSVRISLASPEFDTYLTVENADGTEVARDDDSGESTNSLVTLPSLPAGEYTIVVESYGHRQGSATQEGAFTLSVNEVQTHFIEYTQNVEDTLTGSDLNRAYVFTGQAGDSVVINLRSDAFDSYLRLQDDSGFDLITNDDSGGSLNSQIGPYELPYSGRYTIIASSLSGNSTGSYTLSLNRADVSDIDYDESVDVTFNEGETVKFLRFPAEAGDLVTITVDSDETLDTAVALNDPSGYSIYSDTDGGGGYDPELLERYLSSEGDYMIMLTTDDTSGGTVEVTLSRAIPPSLDDGAQVIAFSDTVQDRVLVFDADAGVTYRITLDTLNQGSFSPSMTVQQSEQFYSSFSFSGGVGGSFDVVFPQDGEVTVQVSDYSYNNARYEVSLSVVE